MKLSIEQARTILGDLAFLQAYRREQNDLTGDCLTNEEAALKDELEAFIGEPSTPEQSVDSPDTFLAYLNRHIRFVEVAPVYTAVDLVLPDDSEQSLDYNIGRDMGESIQLRVDILPANKGVIAPTDSVFLPCDSNGWHQRAIECVVGELDKAGRPTEPDAIRDALLAAERTLVGKNRGHVPLVSLNHA